MNLGLKKKNAIVCASSQGLGKAAALDLAKEGVHLAICSRKLESNSSDRFTHRINPK